MQGRPREDVPQNSTAFIYAATYDPSPLPDFTATFRFTTPPNFQNFSMQFNLLSKKWWTQIVGDPRGLAPVSTDIGVNAGAGSVQVGLNYGNETSFLVQPTSAPFVTDLDTKVPNDGLLNGAVSFVCSMAGLTITASLVDATGKVLWTHLWNLLDAPYVLGFEVVGQYSGNSLDFTAFDGSLEVNASQPVQASMSPGNLGQSQFRWGTYADPTLFGGKAFPLYWEDETGEASNLWTNIINQSPNHLTLDLSLTKGNQSVNNPIIPLPPPVQPSPPVVVPPTPLPPVQPPQVRWFGILPWLRHVLHLD